ncbi:hypothetical protein OG884_15575 [Streptosporangium sp. NBC_01755]|uniref:hypothetical protein n=1 Tax=Streptosporangium sp. NBC_01755 TaxID=2975949 RepID=UPI002DD8DAFA|nr:hypothetical protein [Streptosporangium sp. NBC_01755]WSD03254.1 hypothetical protein OG884_15575 [Streptosporangium sp. NBC_01755]
MRWPWERRPALDVFSMQVVELLDGDVLARYNAERARGIVHTEEWQARMAVMQLRFDVTHRRRLPRTQHPYEQRPAVSVNVCMCGKWPDHHVHTEITDQTCTCDECRRLSGRS